MEAEIPLKEKRSRKHVSESAGGEREKPRKFISQIRRSLTLRRPDLAGIRARFRNVSCLRSPDGEEPLVEAPRHRSFDIGVGLARRASVFVFLRRPDTFHPYHPYTPKATTRKIRPGVFE